MKKDPTYVIVGRLAAPYGIKGWHHVDTFTDPVDNILKYATWFIEQKGEYQPFEVIEGRPHGKRVVAHLKGIDTPEVAALLSRSNIAVLRSQMPPLNEGEYYWADLEGLTVETDAGDVIGDIQYLYDNVGVAIMVIQTPQRKEVQIPFIYGDTVSLVDLEKRLVVVHWSTQERTKAE